MVDFKQILTEDNTEPNTAFLNKLRNKLPEFFTKDKYDIDEDGNEVLVEVGGFDIQKFQDSLQKNNVNEITDGYTLNFVGKNYAELKTGQPTTTVVIPDVKHNDQQKNVQSENVFLTGNNLDALKHLQRAYTNSIDVIYIDPPYNTGKKDDFVYNDKFDLSDEDLRDTFNMSEDEIKKLHLLNGRSSHSAWLTFMYPRLRIAQQLLKDTGVIFVSIDDNEQANLKLLMDEVFGEKNFLNTLTRITKKSSNNGTQFSPTTDYILAFSKDIEHTPMFSVPLTEEQVKSFNKIDEVGNFKEIGLFQSALKHGGSRYPIETPDGTMVNTPNNQPWRWNESTFIEGKNNKLIVFKQTNNSPLIDEESGEKSKWNIYTKLYLRDRQEAGLHPKTFIDDYQNNIASRELKSLGIPFDFAKPSVLVKYLMNLSHNKNLLVLDFFAGSATTADAVMQLNAEDGGNRKWILNTLDEKTPDDSAARKAGYLTIDEISRERIKQAGEKIHNEHPELDSFDSGFKHYYVKEMDAKTIDTIIDFDPNSIQILKEDVVSEFAGNEVRLGEYYEKSDKDKLNPKFAKVVDTGASGEDTILQTWLINDGYKLDVPVDTIQLVQHNVHYVEEGAMAYIIDQFTQEDVEALLNLIGTQQLNVKTIIVFGYSFDFATMTSLKNNVKTTLDGVRVEVRY